MKRRNAVVLEYLRLQSLEMAYVLAATVLANKRSSGDNSVMKVRSYLLLSSMRHGYHLC